MSDKSAWTMRDRLTGEVRSGESIASGEFNWTDGNWGCDHNRVTEFYGDGSREDEHAQCCMMADGSMRFVLLKLVNPDGSVEFEGEHPDAPRYGRSLP